MSSPGVLVRAVATSGRLSILTGQGFLAVLSRPYEVRLWLREMEQIGVRSLGVAAITAIFTGMVLALQTAYSLPSLGVKYYIGTVVAKSVVRELGPVLTALIVGGRVTDQIDALRSMASDPIKKLVAPKIAATLVMLPALTAIGNFLGIIGGLLIAVFQLQLTPGFYINDVLNALTLEEVFSGLGKSFFFAYFIPVIACHNGLHADGGADGVGRATTNTVVMAAIMVLVSDFFLTKLFYLIG